MGKASKWMLAAAAICIALFAWFVYDDWIHYNEYSQNIQTIEGPFYICVIFRAVLFLLPAFILLFACIAAYVSDNHKPRR